MGEGSGNTREIDLGDDFGPVAFTANGSHVEIGADGRILVTGMAYSKGHLDAGTNGSATLYKRSAPANDTAAKPKTAIEIGDLDDGGIYVGLSAENGKPLHAALADLSEYKTFDEALAAAEQLKAAHPTAHVPTPEELDKNLFNNRNTGHLKGTFNISGSFPASVYRSSAPYYSNGARVQYFVGGYQLTNYRNYRHPVRLVW